MSLFSEMMDDESKLFKENAELKRKLEWMTKKRWALEMCICEMDLSNILRISGPHGNNEAIRKSHKELKEAFDRHIKWAGGITYLDTWGRDDFKELPPCWVTPENMEQEKK